MKRWHPGCMVMRLSGERGKEVDMSGKRVLIVDDDENLLFNLGAYLENEGFEICCVSGFHEALQVLIEDRFDVALIDYRLVDRKGTDLIREIRARNPLFPVVLMSAYLDDWVEALAQSYRPLTWLRKPFNGDEVVRAVDEAADGRAGS
ncbi:MAG: response regulator [Deltaproteobacteria bacterium]|nr:response regulator [Deltaproteobacteria bacterium]